MIPRQMLLAAALVALASCGSETSEPVAKQRLGPPERFPAGEWQVTALTQQVQAKDRFTPETDETVGKSTTRKICSPAGDEPAFALFADQGGDCSAVDTYAKRGRLK